MVKNTTGGSKHKGMARKLHNAPVSNTIPKLNDEDECYARVTKMCGNGMCYVDFFHKDVIHTQQICHIRGKFRSRNKKHNFVQVGSVLIIGVRSWTNKFDSDLLHVIPSHIDTKHLNLPASVASGTTTKPSVLFEDELEFSNNINMEMHEVDDSNIKLDDDDELDLDAI